MLFIYTFLQYALGFVNVSHNTVLSICPYYNKYVYNAIIVYTVNSEYNCCSCRLCIILSVYSLSQAVLQTHHLTVLVTLTLLHIRLSLPSSQLQPEPPLNSADHVGQPAKALRGIL